MTSDPTQSPLMAALEKFEATEANVVKLERLWEEIRNLIPSGISFETNVEYEDRSRSYKVILEALPRIDGWKPESQPPDLEDLAHNRWDALEVNEPSAQIAVERWLEEPGRELREYHFRFNSKRRALIREVLEELIDSIDADIRTLREKSGPHGDAPKKLPSSEWKDLRDHVIQIEVLLERVMYFSEGFL